MTRKISICGTVFLMLLSLWAVFPLRVNAHPPASVELTYHADKQVLEVKIIHAASDTGKHYIKKVVIKKNGENAGGGEYTGQPDKEVFIYAYTLAAAPGDLLEVSATCSVFGSKFAEFKVP